MIKNTTLALRQDFRHLTREQLHYRHLASKYVQAIRIVVVSADEALRWIYFSFVHDNMTNDRRNNYCSN